ncbi:hypothetical protein V8G54_020940 [Vigna mungo]|uniref:Uncharacterized protein n=1 Tax=Vigna mungo TaxID=3915 RepID=A0AAQ3RWX3_VIGMU
MSSTASSLEETKDASLLSQASLSLSQQYLFAKANISNKRFGGTSIKLPVKLKILIAFIPNGEILFSDKSIVSARDSLKYPFSIALNGAESSEIFCLSQTISSSPILKVTF